MSLTLDTESVKDEILYDHSRRQATSHLKTRRRFKLEKQFGFTKVSLSFSSCDITTQSPRGFARVQSGVQEFSHNSSLRKNKKKERKRIESDSEQKSRVCSCSALCMMKPWQTPPHYCAPRPLLLTQSYRMSSLKNADGMPKQRGEGYRMYAVLS